MKQRFVTGLGLMALATACSPLAPSLSRTTTSDGGSAPSTRAQSPGGSEERVERSLRIPVLIERNRGSTVDVSHSTPPFTLALSDSQIQEFKRASSVEIPLPGRVRPENVHGLVKVDLVQPELETEELNSLMMLKQQRSGTWALKVREDLSDAASAPLLEHVISIALVFENSPTAE